MKTTRTTNEKGVTTSTNWVLDDVIDAFDNARVDNDTLITKVTIQKFEYARTCMRQIMSQNNPKNEFEKLESSLQKRISDLGGDTYKTHNA